MSSSPDAPPTLKLAWCDLKAARYAVERWHYSGSLPQGKTVNVGAWEQGRFIGVVQFGLGSNLRIGLPWGLPQEQVCELQRVALTTHVTPTSQIVAGAVRLLRRHSPGLRLIVSYADPKQGHAGTLYQAMNWVYIGASRAQSELLINGEFIHKRSAFSLYGTASTKALQARGIQAEVAPVEWKHKYVLPLDRKIRKVVDATALPYPKKKLPASTTEAGC